jgi:cell division protein FtsI (penicillin-binding protein 3)
VITEATSARIRQLLRLVVLKGTGRKADVPGYRVGGKTGTAEVAGVGGYSKKANVSTFAGAFPMDHPRYVVVAMLDSPIGNAESFGLTTAAWTAAPVVNRVIARTGAMLGVLPDDKRDVDVSELLPMLWQAPGVAKDKNMASKE